MSVITNNIQPASGQALTIKDEGGTASITVATNGEATFAENLIVGTAGKGIDFSATANGSGTSSVSEILSDYEQGTWSFDMLNDDAQTVSSDQAYYTRIGNIVFCSGRTHISTGGDTSSNRISGLPFTVKNTTDNIFGGTVNYSTKNSVTRIQLFNNDTAGNFVHGDGSVPDYNSLDNTTITFTLIYMVE